MGTLAEIASSAYISLVDVTFALGAGLRGLTPAADAAAGAIAVAPSVVIIKTSLAIELLVSLGDDVFFASSSRVTCACVSIDDCENARGVRYAAVTASRKHRHTFRPRIVRTAGGRTVFTPGWTSPKSSLTFEPHHSTQK